MNLRHRVSSFCIGLVAAGGSLMAFATAGSAVTITPIDGQPVGAAAYVGIAKDFGNSAGICSVCTPPAASFVSDPGGVTSPTTLLFGSIDNGQASASASNSFTVSGGSGHGDAVADLSTGTLKVFAESVGSVLNPRIGALVPALTTISQAGFEDTLTPLATGMMTFEIKLDGTTVTANPDFGGATVGYQFSITPGLPLPGALHGETNTLTADTPGCTGSGQSLSCDLVTTINAQAGVPLDLVLVLQAFAADGQSDFLHTLSLGVTGVAFTSSSGVFLSQPAPSVVSQPMSLTLLAFGVGALAVGRRRKRCSQ
jgi:hypothetical protein